MKRQPWIQPPSPWERDSAKEPPPSTRPCTPSPPQTKLKQVASTRQPSPTHTHTLSPLITPSLSRSLSGIRADRLSASPWRFHHRRSHLHQTSSSSDADTPTCHPQFHFGSSPQTSAGETHLNHSPEHRQSLPDARTHTSGLQVNELTNDETSDCLCV